MEYREPCYNEPKHQSSLDNFLTCKEIINQKDLGPPDMDITINKKSILRNHFATIIVSFAIMSRNIKNVEYIWTKEIINQKALCRSPRHEKKIIVKVISLPPLVKHNANLPRKTTPTTFCEQVSANSLLVAWYISLSRY